jgi:hypothetical protein
MKLWSARKMFGFPADDQALADSPMGDEGVTR